MDFTLENKLFKKIQVNSNINKLESGPELSPTVLVETRHPIRQEIMGQEIVKFYVCNISARQHLNLLIQITLVIMWVGPRVERF